MTERPQAERVDERPDVAVIRIGQSRTVVRATRLRRSDVQGRRSCRSGIWRSCPCRQVARGRLVGPIRARRETRITPGTQRRTGSRRSRRSRCRPGECNRGLARRAVADTEKRQTGIPSESNEIPLCASPAGDAGCGRVLVRSGIEPGDIAGW